MSERAFLLEFFKDLPDAVRRTAILAGGAFRSVYDGKPCKDYDLFFRSYEDYLTARAALAALPKTVVEVPAPAGTGQFYVVPSRRLLNLVGFHFGTPQEHMEAFDFRCCMFAGWLSEDGPEWLCHPEAAADVLGRRVVLMNNNGDERTIARVARYHEYGYTIVGVDAYEPAAPPPVQRQFRQLLRSVPFNPRGAGSDGVPAI